jgi:hypothetical protein
MADWQFDGGPVALGIDIGWSKTKKSCAVAVTGLVPPAGKRDWITYSGGKRPIAVALFRFSDLLPAVRELIGTLKIGHERVTVVVDGPIGAAGRPTANRHVDSEFARGEFNGRMQPSAVASGDGPRYTEVTDQLMRALHDAAGAEYPAALWDGRAATGPVVCETHPTVGLALLLPKQDRATLPTRKAARRLPADNASFVRAKSDWYWQLGAGRWVAEEALRCPAVARETHHERVAGLYCLAVANLLAAATPHVAAVGGDDGVYVIPSVIDRGWEADVERVGVRAGVLEPQDQSAFVTAGAASSVAVSNALPASEPDETDAAENGDAAVLILTDNGGVWTKHNDWLDGMDSEVVVRADDGEVIRLRVGNRPDRAQWVAANGEQTPLRLARQRGFDGEHLSKDRAWEIPVEVIEEAAATGA